MPHGRQHAVEQTIRLEVEKKVEALHEMPGGHAVTQQHQQQHEQQRHHDPQAALQPCDHAAGDNEPGQQHKQAVPQRQPPGITGQRAERSPRALGADTVESTATHADDVIQRPAGHHTVERQNQQRSDHAHQRGPRPFRRGTGLQGQAFEAIDRALPPAPPDQRLGQHDRQPHQEDAHQVHDDERAAAIHASHVGELPDVAQADRRTGRRQDEHPATGPGTVDRNLVARH
jgi:hypothetical protein